ncbi:hypothetical protein [Bacillus smithii]|uniref:hypothetical protein n=1 Tax=Bacillus smithii TaxID=1479 RepID=UPI0030C944C4
MNKNQLTCNQKICFIFEFWDRQIWLPRKIKPLKRSYRFHQVNSRHVRELQARLSVRLEKIACMMDILQEAHDCWMIYEKKNQIIMETDSFDFSEALDILSRHGFTNDDYILKVEYERKWGML